MKKRDLSEAMRIMGSKGGKRRAAKMSPERRSEIARKAAAKRWEKRDAAKETK